MWNEFLNEAKSEKKYVNTPVIVLGHKHSGKRSLIEALMEISKTTMQMKKNLFDPNKLNLKGLTTVLDYTYLNVIDLYDPDYRRTLKICRHPF